MKTFYEYLVLVENNDEPTEIGAYGNKYWRNAAGQLHRVDGPAVEGAHGHREWWIDGELHREDGPAIEWAKGDKAKGDKTWYLHGVIHREDGPAIERANGDEAWCKNGATHREDGPAIVRANGDKAWCFNNEMYSKEDYYKKMKEEIIKKIGETTASDFGFDEEDAWDNPLTLALADYLEDKKNDSKTANQIRNLMRYWRK